MCAFYAECRCVLDEGDPRHILYRPVCEHEAPTEELRAAVRVCQNTCSCYDGLEANFVMWPGGPEPIGTVLLHPVAHAGLRA